jgi:hypothetical protein
MDIPTRFMHRLRIGSVDSICTKCERTIASAETESELGQLERIHQCEGFDSAASINPANK